MEYFDTYNSGYIAAYKTTHRAYKIRLELLDYFEGVIGEITKDLSISATGQISVNRQQLTRRSINLTMINVDNKYVPSPNNPFWIERKFKVWLGVCNGEDIYWWSYGVFITQDATSDGNTVTVTGIDKGGALDGTLKTNMLDATYTVKHGSSLTHMIRDALLLTQEPDDYNVLYSASLKPIDPVPPVIDIGYNTVYTQADVNIESGSYLGELFTSVADGYGADVYYNTNGHLVLSEMADAIRIEGYNYMARQWEFSADDSMYSGSNFEYAFSGINAVTVFTNVSEIGRENVSYTAYNNNPISPMRVSLVGVRRMEAQEVSYVDVTPQEMTEKCRTYAEYLLLKESLVGMNVTFNAPILPHLDVGKTIGITDSKYGIESDTFVVQSITVPLSAGEMTITASNVTWLPNDKTKGVT